MSHHLDTPYINHILDIIKDIEESINRSSKENFKKDKDKREANIRRIEIISEDIKNISNKLKEKYPEVGWEKFAKIKESLTNHYFGADHNIVWNILNNSPPILKNKLIDISKSEKQ